MHLGVGVQEVFPTPGRGEGLVESLVPVRQADGAAIVDVEPGFQSLSLGRFKQGERVVAFELLLGGE